MGFYPAAPDPKHHVWVVFEPSAGPIQLPSKRLTSQFDVVSIDGATFSRAD